VRLVVIALFDDETRARATSFEILRWAQVPIFAEVRPEVLKRRLQEVPSDLHDMAWAYLVDVTRSEDLKTLQEWAPGTWLESRVQWLTAWMEAGRHLNAFLPKAPDPQLIPEPMKQAIRDGMSQLSDASLEALRSMPLLGLSEAALTELRRRGIPVSENESAPDTLRNTLLLSALQHRGALRLREGVHRISKVAIDDASFLGTALETTETDEDRYERLSREDNASLRDSLDWYDLNGPPSYRLLVERGEITRDVAREDLSNKFQRLHDESYQRMEMSSGAEVAAKLQEGFNKFQEFITEQFTTETLAAFAAEPNTDDVVMARQFLNNDRVRSSALRIIASKGTAADVKGLIDIARSSYGDDRKLALEGVQRLSANKLETARTLVKLEGREMLLTGLWLACNQPGEEAVPFFEELLSHEDGDLRLAAVGELHKRVDSAWLAEVLKKYIEQERYFYNVVAWLDRLLYAPAPISNYYAMELNKSIERLQR
jgi:hypothetical protein